MARIYGRMLSREGVRSARSRNSAGGDQGQGGFHHFLRIDRIGKDLGGAEKAGGEDEDRPMSGPVQPPVAGTASVTGSRSIIVNPSMVSQICSTSAMQPMTRLGMLTLSLL